MALRTVRLDDASEQILKELMAETGKSISTVLKEGLLALQGCQSRTAPEQTGLEMSQEIHSGRPRSDSIGPASELRRGVREAMLRRNLRL